MSDAPQLTSIAAVAENGVIGAGGDMAWNIPADFAHFKATTMAHPMIMGRTTFATMGTLPGRRSIVVTHDPEFAPAQPAHVDTSVTVVHSVDEALEQVAGQVAFVVGGAQIYAATMDHVTRLLISEIPLAPEGDAHFPTIDPAVWVETQRAPRDGFTLVMYERRTS